MATNKLRHHFFILSVPALIMLRAAAAQQAEQEFSHHVAPPQTDSPAQSLPGEVVDRQAPPIDDTQYEALCQAVRRWTIRPANWDSPSIASYFDVNVPMGTATVTEVAGSLGPCRAPLRARPDRQSIRPRKCGQENRENRETLGRKFNQILTQQPLQS